jgi:hypothetical protein
MFYDSIIRRLSGESPAESTDTACHTFRGLGKEAIPVSLLVARLEGEYNLEMPVLRSPNTLERIKSLGAHILGSNIAQETVRPRQEPSLPVSDILSRRDYKGEDRTARMMGSGEPALFTHDEPKHIVAYIDSLKTNE